MEIIIFSLPSNICFELLARILIEVFAVSSNPLICLFGGFGKCSLVGDMYFITDENLG